MGMDDHAWARHANPWSAWTRLIGAAPIFFAVWSVHWIGWRSAAPIAVAALWALVNPRLFPPPKSADAWATKAVLGERVFLNRKAVPVRAGHVRAGWATTLIAFAFFALFIHAFATRNFWAGIAAWSGAVLAKIWFVDRMVRLWEEMKDKDPRYEAWARAQW